MSKKTLVLMLALAMAFVAACKSEIDNKPAATVSEPAAAEKAEEAKEAPAEVAQALKQVEVQKEGSSIGWVGAKVTGDHTGGFNEWSATASIDEKGNLVGVKFEVDTTSVFSDNDMLTDHLKSEDFFDVAKYPKSTFVSTSITEQAADGATHQVKGNLELRGVTKEIQFPATITSEGGKVTAKSEFTLNRSDFGITYTGKADDLIKEEVLMKLSFTADAAGAAKAEAGE